MTGLIIVVNYEQELEISSFLHRLSEYNPGLEVIVVDDGSKDSSATIAEKMGFRVLRREKNNGVGAAIRTGIEFARSAKRFDFVLIMSSNGKMRPEEIPTVIDPLLGGRADYV